MGTHARLLVAFLDQPFALNPMGLFSAPLTILFILKNADRNAVVLDLLVYTARIGDCRHCELRAKCQESLSTLKPRQGSSVFWPLTAPQAVPLAPILGPPEPVALPSPALGRFPVLWKDWPRCHIRRHWMQVVRSETVVVAMASTQEQTEVLDEPLITRAQRAHWRFSWQQRLARNARPATAPSLTLTLHGLPATFAHAYGFALLDAA